jgi:hypothetical protein
MKKLLVCIMIFCGASVKGEIISILSMVAVREKVETLLQKYAPKDLFVAFDVDMTLTQPNHPAIYYPALKKYYSDHKAIIEKMPADQKDLPNVLAIDRSSRLVEKKTPKVLESLQRQGVKTIAFTATLTGQIADYPRFEVVRYERLKDLGLVFEDSFGEHPDVALTQCSAHRGNYPVFHKGILSANGEKGKTRKGDVLVAFLEYIQKHTQERTYFSPKVIIIVDDRKTNLESIEKSLRDHHPDILFIGMEYEGAFNYAPEEISREDFIEFWEGLVKRAKTLFD